MFWGRDEITAVAEPPRGCACDPSTMNPPMSDTTNTGETSSYSYLNRPINCLNGRDYSPDHCVDNRNGINWRAYIVLGETFRRKLILQVVNPVRAGVHQSVNSSTISILHSELQLWGPIDNDLDVEGTQFLDVSSPSSRETLVNLALW
jgi:hypothetical protein